jgi:hypothetical protein
MKRFTSEDRNAQEGRELIPAQSNAEEEAPQGLSFEGGLAGARTLSRRQALGLLGGSLAGFSLLSLGLVGPAKARLEGIDHLDIITLKCLGDKPGPRYLDGRTQDGTVGLAPHTNPPYTGTKWRVEYLSPWAGPDAPYYNQITLRCEGTGPGHNARFLDGRTQDATVGLAPGAYKPFTGTRWELEWVQEVSRGYYSLYCKGTGPGDARYLDGRTQDGTVGLAPTTNDPFTGTHWWIDVVGKSSSAPSGWSSSKRYGRLP